MNGVKFASVWIPDIFQWVPLSQVVVIQRYFHEKKNCAQFLFEGKIMESYIEYKEI